MLKDQTAEALRVRAKTFRTAARQAEDTCVKRQLMERARDFDDLVGMVTPVLSAEETAAVQ